MVIPEAKETAKPPGGLSEEQDLLLLQGHRRVLGAGTQQWGLPEGI